MSSENPNMLPSLVAISKIDAAIAGINAQRKKLEDGLKATAAAYKKEDSERLAKAAQHAAKKAEYNKEEKRVRDERDKLVSRRKALTTLSNYKLQQAAEKEIDNASRLLSSQEEASFNILEEVEALGVQIAKHEESLKGLKAEFEAAQKEGRATVATFDERIAQYKQERDVLLVNVDSKFLNVYEKVREKFVMDAVAPIVNGTCAGCFMQIGPQIVLQIGKGSSLARCPGCGRILYVESEKEKEKH